MLPADQELRQLAARTDQLLAEIEGLPETRVRATAVEAIQAIVQLYGAGLARIVRQLEEHDAALLSRLADDELIAHLLILHDLHPIELATRVGMALEDVRPYLQSHGGNVELVDITGGVLRVRLEGSCHGCPSSSMTLKLAIEEAVHTRAPEIERVEAVNPTPTPPVTGNFVPLSSLRRRDAPQDNRTAWTTIADLPVLTPGTMGVVEIDGAALLLLKLDDTFYAYRNECPGCGESLEGGKLSGNVLACPGCAAPFDVRQAGRSPADPTLFLEPIPLLVDGKQVRVAVPALAGKRG